MTPEEKLLALIQQDKRQADTAAKTSVVAPVPIPSPRPSPESDLLKNKQSPQDGSAGTPRPTENQEISQGGAKPSSLRSPSGGVGPAEPGGGEGPIPPGKKLKLAEVPIPPAVEPGGRGLPSREPEIRDPKSEDRGQRTEDRSPQSATLSPSRSGGVPGLLLLNRILAVVVLFLVGCVFYSVASIRPEIAKALEMQIRGAGSVSVAPAVVSNDGVIPVESYLEKVSARNIFVPRVIEKDGSVVKVEPAGAPKDLKLVGVSVDADVPAESMAIIRGKADSKTYFVKLGQTVGDTDYVLDRVLPDRIILKQRKQEYELK